MLHLKTTTRSALHEYAMKNTCKQIDVLATVSGGITGGVFVLASSDIHASMLWTHALQIAIVADSYQAPSFWCWVVVGVLAAHLTLLLQQGQGLAGI